jgi:hypothetical protein
MYEIQKYKQKWEKDNRNRPLNLLKSIDLSLMSSSSMSATVVVMNLNPEMLSTIIFKKDSISLFAQE